MWICDKGIRSHMTKSTTVGGWEYMHKEELIQLHTLMAQMKNFFEGNGAYCNFDIYENLGISPVHVHRSKAEHKHAIFVLGSEIASIISDDDFSGTGRTSVRMNELAKKALCEIDHIK